MPTDPTAPVAVCTTPAPLATASLAIPDAAEAAFWLTTAAVGIAGTALLIAPVTGTVAAAAAVTGTGGVPGTDAFAVTTAGAGALGKFALALLSTLTSTP